MLLRKEGYHTSFFHGGNNGTMGFENFARAAEIEFYYGRSQYNNDNDYDGKWGIWDEPFLQYFARQLNTFRRPFFTTIYTISSHHPYQVPDKFSDRFKEGKLPILKTIRYTDFALGEFFKTVSGMPWFRNTIFVFTADHAAQEMRKTYHTSTSMYEIPIAFYCPSDSSMRGYANIVAQQIDIMPTILVYLNYKKPFFAFGDNLLDPESSHEAVNFINGTYQLIEGDYVIQFNGQQIISFYNRIKHEQKDAFNSPEKISDPAEREIFKKMETRIKAIVQTYNYCLINNRLTPYQNKDTIQ
jgi:phosphoglycerol transferase MdoB-like AlkP superfamily enzyme